LERSHKERGSGTQIASGTALGFSRRLTPLPGTANRQAKVQHCMYTSVRYCASLDYAPASGSAQVRANMRLAQGEITKDAIYIDAERRFEELEKETKRLHDESKKYAPITCILSAACY
jgi:hypothetical protein